VEILASQEGVSLFLRLISLDFTSRSKIMSRCLIEHKGELLSPTGSEVLNPLKSNINLYFV